MPVCNEMMLCDYAKWNLLTVTTFAELVNEDLGVTGIMLGAKGWGSETKDSLHCWFRAVVLFYIGFF